MASEPKTGAFGMPDSAVVTFTDPDAYHANNGYAGQGERNRRRPGSLMTRRWWTQSRANPSLKAAAIYNEPGEGGTAEEWRINPVQLLSPRNEIIRSGLKQGWLAHYDRSLVWRTDWTAGV